MHQGRFREKEARIASEKHPAPGGKRHLKWAGNKGDSEFEMELRDGTSGGATGDKEGSRGLESPFNRKGGGRKRTTGSLRQNGRNNDQRFSLPPKRARDGRKLVRIKE